MRPGLERSALVSTKSPKYLLSIQDGVNDLRKKKTEKLPNLSLFARSCSGTDRQRIFRWA